MAAISDHIEVDVLRIVASHAGIPREHVSPGARLWHDLQLAGDDFADLIEELHRTHGVTLRGDLGDYCPTEAALHWASWWWPFRGKSTYRELTIAELATAARSGVKVG